MRLLLAIWIITASSASAQVGLAPSPHSLGRAEAVTAGAYGTDALFYNPATLPYSRLNLTLFGLEGTGGLDEVGLTRRAPAEAVTLEDYFKELSAQGQVYSGFTTRAVDFSAPFVSVSTFANIHLSATDHGTQHEYLAQTDLGAIAGAAVKIHKTSIGYSQYQMVRAQVISTPSLDQVRTINELAVNEELEVDSLPYQDFTSVHYGGATGHNIGIMQYWWEDNPSGIGIALLNAGVTKFEPTAPVEQDEVEGFEKDLRREAAEYGFEVETPESLPQMLNVGMVLGMGGETNDLFDARLGVDVHDVLGDKIENKLAASYDIGVTLPDDLALLASMPIMNTNWLVRASGRKPTGEGRIMHLGLLNLRVFGGIRESSHGTQGGAIGLHLGVERLVSVIRIDIEGFESFPLGQSDYVPRKGGRLRIGLTLIF